jgi:hypothetical protein
LAQQKEPVLLALPWFPSRQFRIDKVLIITSRLRLIELVCAHHHLR